jgi:hypothetical protein
MGLATFVRWSWGLSVWLPPDDTRKRGAEVTFREGAEGGIHCSTCAASSQRS